MGEVARAPLRRLRRLHVCTDYDALLAQLQLLPPDDTPGARTDGELEPCARRDQPFDQLVRQLQVEGQRLQRLGVSLDPQLA